MPIEVIDKIKPKNGGNFPVADAEDIAVDDKHRLPDVLLPPVTRDDEGKVLRVVGGSWRASELILYEGDTEVIPSPSDQTLETAGKMVSENISVKKIPYAEVGNTSGGKTVTIGG